MRARLRTLAALLALFAFSASYVEQAWASLCAGDGASPAAAVASPVTHGGHAGDSGVPPGEPAPDAECPVQAVAAGCTVVSLPPAASTAAALPALPDAVPPVCADQTHDLLLSSSLFRPPQR
jgi:hypothetical protein